MHIPVHPSVNKHLTVERCRCQASKAQRALLARAVLTIKLGVNVRRGCVQYHVRETKSLGVSWQAQALDASAGAHELNELQWAHACVCTQMSHRYSVHTRTFCHRNVSKRSVPNMKRCTLNVDFRHGAILCHVPQRRTWLELPVTGPA